MTDIATTEREQLTRLLHEVGPLAPTLCEGWNARDLAAHLYVRENEPWNAAGIMIKPLANITERAMRRVQREHDFDQLVELLASGPHGLSPFRIPLVNRLGNGFEYFVHHEDVRRAMPNPAPRKLSDEIDQQLWEQLIRLATARFRSPKVGIVLVRQRVGEPTGEEQVVSLGSGLVRLTGEPAELTMWCAGRGEHAAVEFEGSSEDIELVKKIQLKV